MSYYKYNSYQQNNKQAVALGYNANKDIAPKIVAKGTGLVAEKIIEIARQNGILTHHDPDLVNALSLLELNELIPIETYTAVAEILSCLYKFNDKLKKQSNEQKNG